MKIDSHNNYVRSDMSVFNEELTWTEIRACDESTLPLPATNTRAGVRHYIATNDGGERIAEIEETVNDTCYDGRVVLYAVTYQNDQLHLSSNVSRNLGELLSLVQTAYDTTHRSITE